MNDFVASRVCWTIATSWRTSPAARSGSLRDEPLHDLGLEDDVRQALGRAVVHRPGDLAAQVLLGAQEQPRDTAGGIGCRVEPSTGGPPHRRASAPIPASASA